MSNLVSIDVIEQQDSRSDGRESKNSINEMQLDFSLDRFVCSMRKVNINSAEVRLFTRHCRMAHTSILLRRRHRFLFIVCLTLVLFIVQAVIYSRRAKCEQNSQLTWKDLPANVSDRARIIQLNPKILCWIPTTRQRLDRASVVYE